MLTGESVPVEVGEGDAVAGATVNAGGRLVVRATRVGDDTQLAQMARLVEAAQSGKAEVQRLADRISGVFVPVVIVIAVATLGVWLAAGFPVTAALTAAVAVLIIACPCALGLATPTALLVGGGPRGSARRAHQRTRSAGVDPQGRHHRARQDRHRHHRQDDPRRRDHRAATPTAKRCCATPEPWRTPPSIPSHRRSPRAAKAELGALPAARGLRRTWKAKACKALSTATPSSSGGRACWPIGPSTSTPTLSAAKARAESEGKTAVAVGLGRPRPRDPGGRRHRQTHQR